MHQLYHNISKVFICTYTENHVNMSVVKPIKNKKIKICSHNQVLPHLAVLSSEYQFLDAYEAEGLLGVCIFLVKVRAYVYFLCLRTV